MAKAHRCLNCIMPPHIMDKLLDHKDEQVRDAALSTLINTARLRGERSVRSLMGSVSAPAGGRRTIFDCAKSVSLTSAKVVRSEDTGESADASANRAFEGLGATADFFRAVFNRQSIDDKGMRLDGYVHRGNNYNNAFWNGRAMVFGDGDGVLFTDFTASVDVIAHELTHGVTEFTAGFEYHKQAGALNESMSDVVGSLVKQYTKRQSAANADWLIGADIFTPKIAADALRSLKAPGTAYDNKDMGRDPQPDHMSKYVVLPDNEDKDWGGVHINSGIPNHAFFLTATGVGGNAWEAPGHVWYETLKASSPRSDFQQFADTTYLKAGQLYGTGSTVQKALVAAWEQVGVPLTSSILAGADTPGGPPVGSGKELTAQLAELNKKIDRLTKDVAALKKR